MIRDEVVLALNSNVYNLFRQIELKDVHLIYEKYIEKMSWEEFLYKYQKLRTTDFQQYIELKIFDLLQEFNILKVGHKNKIFYL